MIYPSKHMPAWVILDVFAVGRHGLPVVTADGRGMDGKDTTAATIHQHGFVCGRSVGLGDFGHVFILAGGVGVYLSLPVVCLVSLPLAQANQALSICQACAVHLYQSRLMRKTLTGRIKRPVTCLTQ